jgi:hypothetical protein
MKTKPLAPGELLVGRELKSLSPVYGRQEISQPGRLAITYI